MVSKDRLCAQGWHSSVLSQFVPFFLVLSAAVISEWQSLVHSCLRGGRWDLQMIGVDGWGFLVIC